MSPFHLIVGAGVVGSGIAAELEARGQRVVRGSRSAREGSGSIVVDALNAASLTAASQGASHIYLTLGLEYSGAVWERDWPVVMTNAIQAAHATGAKLVFFDNIYMYGPAPLQVPITEAHPIEPVSRKGRVRKAIAEQLMQAHADGAAKAVIGRCADYYGPKAQFSGLYIMGLKPLLEGKAPQFLNPPTHLHSYTHTGDAARGLVELALDDAAYGEVWHLPTVTPPLNDTEILAKLAELTGNHKHVTVVPRPLLPVLGLFVPVVREVREMLYQTETDYVFSSAKFDARYPNFAKTPYDLGLKQMVDSFKP